MTNLNITQVSQEIAERKEKEREMLEMLLDQLSQDDKHLFAQASSMG